MNSWCASTTSHARCTDADSSNAVLYHAVHAQGRIKTLLPPNRGLQESPKPLLCFREHLFAVGILLRAFMYSYTDKNCAFWKNRLNISYPSPLLLHSACAVTLSCFGRYNRSCLLTGTTSVTFARSCNVQMTNLTNLYSTGPTRSNFQCV